MGWGQQVNVIQSNVFIRLMEIITAYREGEEAVAGWLKTWSYCLSPRPLRLVGIEREKRLFKGTIKPLVSTQ